MQHTIEVERKRDITGRRGEVEARLTAAGFRSERTVYEADTYYSRPDTDYLTTLECLRVRRRDGFAEITYKPASTPATHSIEDVIAKHETNVRLADTEQAEAAQHLLEAIGMTPLVRVTKNRTVYRAPERTDIAVCLDDLPGIGTFAETEITTTDLQSATALLDSTEHALGLLDCPVIAVPYRDLALEQGSLNA